MKSWIIARKCPKPPPPQSRNRSSLPPTRKPSRHHVRISYNSGMAKAPRKKRRSSVSLFRFDFPYLQTYGLVAGVDEAGRGPLAGPVGSAAVILPKCSIPYLADSKLLRPDLRVD